MAEEYYEAKYEEPETEEVKKPGLLKRCWNWLDNHSVDIGNVLMAAGLLSGGYQVGQSIAKQKAWKTVHRMNNRLQDHNMLQVTFPDGQKVDQNNNEEWHHWVTLANDVCGHNGTIEKPKGTR